MNLFSNFNELNEDFDDRQDLIDAIKKSGRNYNFDKYTDEQLYRIWERVRLNPVKPFTIKKAPVIRQPKHELDLDFVLPHANEYCDNCGEKLTTTGDCPKCDLGEEDLSEAMLLDWVVMNNNQTQSAATTNNISTPVHKQGTPYIVTIYYDSSAHKLRAQADDGVHGLANVAFPNKLRNQAGQQYRVGQLIWNGKNYRAVGSITPINSVANTQNNIITEKIKEENLKMNFISTFEELNKLYEEVQPVEEPQAEEELVEATDEEEIEIVDDEALVANNLMENNSNDPSKNRAIDPEAKWEKTPWRDLKNGDVFMYHLNADWFEDNKYVGPIRGEKPYSLTVKEADIEKIMNKATGKPYEKIVEREDAYYCGKFIVDCNGNPVGGEPVYFPTYMPVFKLVEDLKESAEVTEEEPKQIICECSKCGALVIKEEADVKADEETNLVNVEDECEYCEEAEGYKIIGVVAPYEAAEEIAEEPIEEAFEMFKGPVEWGKLKKNHRLELVDIADFKKGDLLVEIKDINKITDDDTAAYVSKVSKDGGFIDLHLGGSQGTVSGRPGKKLIRATKGMTEQIKVNLAEEEVEEALLKDVSINVNANGNNVPVLNNALGK